MSGVCQFHSPWELRARCLTRLHREQPINCKMSLTDVRSPFRVRQQLMLISAAFHPLRPNVESRAIIGFATFQSSLLWYFSTLRNRLATASVVIGYEGCNQDEVKYIMRVVPVCEEGNQVPSDHSHILFSASSITFHFTQHTTKCILQPSSLRLSPSWPLRHLQG